MTLNLPKTRAAYIVYFIWAYLILSFLPYLIPIYSFASLINNPILNVIEKIIVFCGHLNPAIWFSMYFAPENSGLEGLAYFLFAEIAFLVISLLAILILNRKLFVYSIILVIIGFLIAIFGNYFSTRIGSRALENNQADFINIFNKSKIAAESCTYEIKKDAVNINTLPGTQVPKELYTEKGYLSCNIVISNLPQKYNGEILKPGYLALSFQKEGDRNYREFIPSIDEHEVDLSVNKQGEIKFKSNVTFEPPIAKEDIIISKITINSDYPSYGSYEQRLDIKVKDSIK